MTNALKLTDIVKTPRVKSLRFKEVDLKDKNIDGGIYRMYDRNGQVVYVGKSGNLKRRIQEHIHRRSHTAYFMDGVVKIEWHQEPDPVYETLLEAIFIAYHLPKFNDEVKDAKEKFGEEYGE